MSNKSPGPLAPFDLQRVEVLRGPQGVLLGSASMGGAVRYVFTPPGPTQQRFTLRGRVSGTQGGGTNHAEHVMANLPLGERSALRVVIGHRDDSGHVDNPMLGLKDTNRLQQSGARVLGSFAATAALDVTALLATQSTQVDDSAKVMDVATASKRLSRLSPRSSAYDLGGLRLSSNTGRLAKRWVGAQTLGRFVAFYGPDAYVFNDEHTQAWSQEIRVASDGPDPFSWLAGAFWQRFDYAQRDGLQIPARTIPSNLDSSATERAVFANGEYALDGGLTLGLGGRYYQARNDVNSAVNQVRGQARSSDSGLTPRASLKVRLPDDALAYVLWSKGYRFGGINVTHFNPNLVAPGFVAPTTYASDSPVNHEAGLRWSPTPRLRLDATLFRLDWRDLQLNVQRPGDGLGCTANIGRARVSPSNAGQAQASSSTWRAGSISPRAACTEATEVGGTKRCRDCSCNWPGAMSSDRFSRRRACSRSPRSRRKLASSVFSTGDIGSSSRASHGRARSG